EKKDAEAAIQKLIAAEPNATVAQKLQCITEALAAYRPGYAEDIRSRKGTLAHGFGYVHEKFYRLEGWAIDVAEPVSAPPPAEPVRLAVLGLDDQRNEQIALARATHNLSLAEESAVAALSEDRFPEKTGYELIGSGWTRS